MTTSFTKRFGLIAGSVVLAACAIGTPALAADFFKDKKITFIVGYNPGGGYDLYSRTFAAHFGANVPGNPKIVVQNMPGGGSLRAANYLYNVAPKDGTVIGMIDQSISIKQVLDPGSLKGDVRKFNWIGRISSNQSILYAWHTAPVKNIKQAFKEELIIAAPGASSRMLTKAMKNMLGMKLKIVTGYRGTRNARLALERGEVHATTQPWTAMKANQPTWIEGKKVNVLLQANTNGHPDLKAVPLVTDLGRNDEEKKLLGLIAGGAEVGRSVVAPPALPADRVATLHSAFDKTMKDAKYLATIKKVGLDLAPQNGKTLQKSMADAIGAIPPELAAKARKLAEFKPRKKKAK